MTLTVRRRKRRATLRRRDHGRLHYQCPGKPRVFGVFGVSSRPSSSFRRVFLRNFHQRIQRTSRDEVRKMRNRQYDFRTETRGDEERGLLIAPKTQRHFGRASERRLGAGDVAERISSHAEQVVSVAVTFVLGDEPKRREARRLVLYRYRTPR